MSDIGSLLCVVLFWSGISAKGLDLKGLVQLALALEDRCLCFIEMVALNLKFEAFLQELVSHEAKNRLKTAYQIHDFPTILGINMVISVISIGLQGWCTIYVFRGLKSWIESKQLMSFAPGT